MDTRVTPACDSVSPVYCAHASASEWTQNRLLWETPVAQELAAT
jgi:hypothetical protein